MGAAFKAFFALFTTLFTAITKLANAGSELATFAEEEAEAVNIKARMARNQALTIARHNNAQSNKALGISEDGNSITDTALIPTPKGK